MPREFPPSPAIQPVGGPGYRDELGQPTYPASVVSGLPRLPPALLNHQNSSPSRGDASAKDSGTSTIGASESSASLIRRGAHQIPLGLHRIQSWPPVLPMELADSSSELASKPLKNPVREELSQRRALIRSGNPELARLGPGTVSRRSSKLSISSSSISSLSTVDERKAGFRANVAKRWNLSRKYLQDQMQERAHRYGDRRRQHRVEQHTAQMASRDKDKEKEGGEARKTPADLASHSTSVKQNDTSKDREPSSERKSSTSKRTLMDEQVQPPQRPRSRSRIFHSPHELSRSPIVEVVEEDNRGRQKSLYIKEFSSSGRLVVAEEPRKPSRDRTSSRRRGIWKEPPPGIAPVQEERVNASPVISPPSSPAFGPEDHNESRRGSLFPVHRGRPSFEEALVEERRDLLTFEERQAKRKEEEMKWRKTTDYDSG